MKKPPEPTMIPERHHGTRPLLSLPVQLLYGKRRFCSARVCDLSIQGMSLILRNLTLPAGTLVELELDGLGRDWRVDAVVVRSAGTEVSVMFREPQPELFRGLVQAGVGGEMEGEIGTLSPPPISPERPQLARH